MERTVWGGKKKLRRELLAQQGLPHQQRSGSGLGRCAPPWVGRAADTVVLWVREHREGGQEGVQLCHLALWPWACYLTFLNLIYVIHKTRRIILLPKGYWEYLGT